MQENQNPNTKRRQLFIYLTALFLGLFVLWLLYWLFWGQFYESTDDAYVNGNILPITAQVAGTVVRVNVNDTQFVHAGESLVRLDPIDTQIRLEHANADLANAVRITHQLFIQKQSLQASISTSQIAQHKAQVDLERRQQAAHFGGVSKEELIHAQDQLKTSNAELTKANAAFLTNQALIENTTLMQHPQVLTAIANLRKAYMDYVRSDILAPAAGEIAKRTVQVGQRVDVNAPLMSLVPLNEMWVDANFKEKQLRFMRVGQPVTLTADLYGTSVHYHGKIAGFSAGTGSAFALLPAQNATGNWIKVVQRLPVRIAFDADELKHHPLRIGLSMKVSVNIHHHTGKILGTLSAIAPNRSDIYNQRYQKVEALIHDVIEKNSIKGLSHTPVPSDHPS